ncbi:dipeptide ABC transporter ATP-binding protein [Streptomyces sp. NPDC051018]|uniref:dipeptide ABC transporter ATP-binding protein n=1 Tax=Streptomyces sp. NPDC051018 TaxID=3365639 RepID=UPI00379F8BB2
MTEQQEPLLTVRSLDVSFPTVNGLVPAVRDVTFTLAPRETLAIVGESGSGKSTTALAVLGLLPDQAKVSGSIRFRDRELLPGSEKVFQQVRGAQIAYVPQNPFGSLNPVYTVGTQITEALRAHHRDLGKAEARDRTLELLATVGIDNPTARIDAYPHQISGGMRQRVVIAMALANRPSLIVADEPTSALDVTVQAQVLEALEAACEASGAALLLITHDMGVVARHADRVLVMYGGRAVESGPVAAVFDAPRMPYTTGLLGGVPRLDTGPGTPLVRMPAPGTRPPAEGCGFSPRCPSATDQCRTEAPPLSESADAEHWAACWFQEELAGKSGLELFPGTGTAKEVVPGPAEADPDPVLSVSGLVKHFTVREREQRRRTTGTVHALCGVSLDVRSGETLAVVGESGSGKSTLSRALSHLEPATSGTIRLDGTELTSLSQRQMRPHRRHVQMVLQDSTAALNPKLTVGSLIAEPLRIHAMFTPGRVAELLSMVGLPADTADRFPGQLSGGQRQRVAIARALAVEPRLLILDEPVSALDVSVQADVLALLRSLQDELRLAYIFVTHDLGVVRQIADRVAVMYLGRFVELGPVDDLLSRPLHPYTRALVSAVPVPDPAVERSRERLTLTGDVPAASSPPSGCRFRTRCPLRRTLDEESRDRCADEAPVLRAHDGDQRTVACHFATSAPIAPLSLSPAPE